MFLRISTVLLGMAAFSAPALAYIGPGMGAGAIGIIIGLLGSIFLALFSIFYYPLKRRLKRSRDEDTDETASGADADAELAVNTEAQEESSTR